MAEERRRPPTAFDPRESFELAGDDTVNEYDDARDCGEGPPLWIDLVSDAGAAIEKKSTSGRGVT
jgi:hypothetical protein